MKTFFLLITFIALGTQTSTAQKKSDKEQITLEKEYEYLKSKTNTLENKVRRLSQESKKYIQELQSMSKDNTVLRISIDSLKVECKKINDLQASDRKTFNQQIKNTNASVLSNQAALINRSVWGGLIAIIILSILFIVFYYLIKRMKKGTSSIDEIRKIQYTLQSAQIKMQEESIKVDNKMLELIEKQLSAAPAMTANAVVDHSLALKVADEIERIEMNLSRMDSTIKGHKQLSKAVQRIKDNFNANGYEIVDMLGKPYNDGMKVTANFVIDENLAQGCQIITGIIKPQINFNGKMIQSAQITVSQNI